MSKEVNEERAPRTVTDVKEMLSKHSNGEIQRTIENCITILQNDHVLADAIRLNLLSERIDIVKPVGWPRSGKTLNDTDMKYILRRMEKYGISSEKKIESAIRIVANENRYHPIRDYLNGLKWDGTERIAHVLHHFLGAAEDEYTCEAMKIFLLGAIKRVFQPGCKFETMLHADYRRTSAGEAAEAGSPAERQGAGQGESTGFRSATVEPLAGRTGAAESICTFNCGKVRKSFSIIVRGDVY